MALNTAGLSVLQQKRARSNLSAERARQNIESLVIKAPMDGVILVRENQDAAGGFFFFGMTLPAYRVGDTTTPGRAIVDIFDISALEIRASVNEQDRANISVGQKVTVRSNVAPSKRLTATVKSVSGLGRADRSAGPLRMFDVILVLDAAEKELRPGTSVSLVAQGKKIERRAGAAPAGRLRGGRQARRLRTDGAGVCRTRDQGRAAHRKPRRS